MNPEPDPPLVRVLDARDVQLAADALAFTIKVGGLLDLETLDVSTLADMADLYARLTGEFD